MHRHLHDESLHLSGMRGLPRWRDFRRQNKRKRSRCHRTSVSGRTIVRSSRTDKLRQQNECDSRRVVCAARSDLAFDVTRKLLPEEEVLGRQLGTGPDHQPQQAHQVCEKGERRREQVW